MSDVLAAPQEPPATQVMPLFFKRVPIFTRSLRLWNATALMLATQRMSDTERACKRTGSPAETLCRNALIGLAQRGAAAKRR